MIEGSVPIMRVMATSCTHGSSLKASMCHSPGSGRSGPSPWPTVTMSHSTTMRRCGSSRMTPSLSAKKTILFRSSTVRQMVSLPNQLPSV